MIAKNYIFQLFKENKQIFILPLVLIIGLLLVRDQIGVFLFHTLAELFSAMVSLLMFVIVWNTRQFTKNDFLAYLGIGYFWIGIIDITHTFAIDGLPFFNISGYNESIRLWLSGRFFEGFVLLSSVFLINKKLNLVTIFTIMSLIASFLIFGSFSESAPIFYENNGLTDTKIYSEYLLIGIFTIAFFFYYMKRSKISKRVSFFLLVSIGITICAEYAFTLYSSIETAAFAAGHLFKFFSFWMIYQAIIYTSLNEPFSLLDSASSNFNSVPHPTITIDLSGNISQLNSSAKELFFDSSKSLVYMPVHDFFHDTTIKKEKCKVCNSIQNSTEINEHIFWHSKLNKWFLLSLKKISVNNNSAGMIQSLTDITSQINTQNKLEEEIEERIHAKYALTLSEQKFKNVLDSSISVIYNFNLLTGKYDYLSPSIFNISGYSISEFTSFTTEEIISKYHPDDIVRIQILIQNLLENKLETFIESDDYRFMHKDGKYRWINDTRKYVLKDNKVVALIGTTTDKTERVSLEKQLRHAQKMETIGTLSSGIAHDFNNILSPIIGYSDMALAKLNEGDILYKDISQILKAGNRAKDLVQQILMFSKEKEKDMKQVNLNNLLMMFLN